MKYIITESQYKSLISEEIKFKTDDSQSDIVSDFVEKNYAKWFDYKSPKLSNFTKNDIINQLNYVIKHYYGLRYKLNRVLVKDNDELIGFLVYSTTTPKKENVENLIENDEYPIMLSAAISPEYRNRGLLKQMMDKANIQKPFIIHTSLISPPGFWEKFGCKKIKEIQPSNFIEYCK